MQNRLYTDVMLLANRRESWMLSKLYKTMKLLWPRLRHNLDKAEMDGGHACRYPGGYYHMAGIISTTHSVLQIKMIWNPVN